MECIWEKVFSVAVYSTVMDTTQRLIFKENPLVVEIHDEAYSRLKGYDNVYAFLDKEIGPWGSSAELNMRRSIYVGLALSMSPGGDGGYSYCSKIVERYLRIGDDLGMEKSGARAFYAFVNFTYSLRYENDHFDDGNTRDVLLALRFWTFSSTFMIPFLHQMNDMDGFSWRTRPVEFDEDERFACPSWVNLMHDLLEVALKIENVGQTRCSVYVEFLVSSMHFSEKHNYGPVDDYFYAALYDQGMSVYEYQKLVVGFQSIIMEFKWYMTDRYMIKAVRTLLGNSEFGSLVSVFKYVGMSPDVFFGAIDWDNLDWMTRDRNDFVVNTVAAIVRYILAIDADTLLKRIGFDRLDAALGARSVAGLLYNHYPAECARLFDNPGTLSGPLSLAPIDDDYWFGMDKDDARDYYGRTEKSVEPSVFVGTPSRCIDLIVSHYNLKLSE